jgi:hypothetical protein
VGCALVLLGETTVNQTRFGIASSTALALVLSASNVFAQAAPTIGGPAADPGPTGAGAPPTVSASTAPVWPASTDQSAQAAPAGDPEPLMWRGTTFTFSQAATTTMLGIGRDNIGHEDEFYGWDFVLAPNLYLFDGKTDKILVFAEAGVSVEWTDAGDTTTKHEPRFRDTQVGAGYNRDIFTSDDKEWATKAGLRARAVFPTSPTSIAQGRYLTSSLGASVTQVVRLLGRESDGLNNLTLVGGLTWSHLFSKSYTPVNGDLERQRQNASGSAIFSDQLSFSSMDIDRLIPSITMILPLYKDLSMTTQFRLVGRFRHQFEGTGCDVNQPGLGGCVTADTEANPVSYLTNSTFDISLTQPIYDIFEINVGYNNETLTLGNDGKARNVFYSPDAQFYLDLVANIDVMYSKASGREKFELPPGPRNTVTADNGTGMPHF